MLEKRTCELCGRKTDSTYHTAIGRSCYDCNNSLYLRHDAVKSDALSVSSKIEDVVYLLKAGFPPREIASLVQEMAQSLDSILTHLANEDDEDYAELDSMFSENLATV